jgi:hypothetical protein
LIPVKFLSQLAAVFLVTLWLPATLHCRLEGLGLAGLFACSEQSAQSEHADDNSCADDGCQTIESGQFVVSKTQLTAALLPAPICLAVHCLLQVAPPVPAAATFACYQVEPLPLQRTWQFTRRAALPARAPDVLNT